jgi:hypothetical protein
MSPHDALEETAHASTGVRVGWVPAGLRVVVDVALSAALIWGFADGAIPGLLATHGGQWAWLGAGAVAMLLLEETADATDALHEAVTEARFTAYEQLPESGPLALCPPGRMAELPAGLGRAAAEQPDEGESR